MGYFIIFINRKPILQNGILDIYRVMVKVLHRERNLSLFWRTYHSLRHWVFLSMGYDQHLRHQLLQNYRPSSNFIIKRNRFPFNDVLLWSHLQIGHLSYWNNTSDYSNVRLNCLILSDSFYCLFYDSYLGIPCTFWYYLRTDHWNDFYDSC